MIRTPSIKNNEVNRDWLIVNAEGSTLGRLASKIAHILRGKNKPFFTPHIDMSDYIIVINAEKIKLTGDKLNQKQYFSHTGYPGGVKNSSLAKIFKDNPEKVLCRAVKGMLPHNKLGRKLNKHLKVYKGSMHPHEPQQPKEIKI